MRIVVHGQQAFGKAVLEALTTQVEGNVANLLVDTDCAAYALSGEPLPGDETSLVLRLANMDQHAEVGEDIATRVHRDDRDAGGNCRSDRVTESVGVRQGHNEPIGLRSDRSVDDLAHLDHVERARSLVLDVNAHVVGCGAHAI